MSTRVADRVEDWDRRSFEGGYRTLHELADQSFSGVIRAGGGELYMTRGACVGLLSGSIEDFESASGTMYESPADALPLLAVMQERVDEQRAQYYSEKTAISEVDQTLSDGGFTGFIELSENVLSGDYYLVYHAGTSMNVAFVGESKQLLDADEAFERANGEVGIYQVYQVDIDPIEIPEPSEPADDVQTAAGEADTGESAPEETVDEPTTDDEPEVTEAQHSNPPDAEPDTSDGESEPGTGSVGTATTAEQTGSTETATGTGQAEQTADSPDTGEEGDATAESDRAVTARETTDEQTPGDAETETESPETAIDEQADTPPRESAEEPGEATDTEPPQPATKAEQSTQSEASQPATKSEGSTRPATSTNQPAEAERTRPETTTPPRTTQPTESSEPAQKRSAGDQSRSTQRGDRATATTDLEQRSIPSLDPARTVEPNERRSNRPKSVTSEPEPVTPEPEPATQPPDTSGQTEAAEPTQTAEPAEPTEPEPTPDQPAQQDEPAGPEPTVSVDSERVETLETELQEREAEIDDLEAELEQTTEQRAELEEELRALRAERDELEETVETLEEQLQQLESELGAATDAEQRLTPGEALAGTDLFVRYHSKGDATLEKAHGSGVRKEDVNGNLRLETHTTFEKANVAVGGKTFDEFLQSRVEYQFVNWVVRQLLFEIRSTGHDTALKDLYDALPRVDRAELSGVVDVVYTEGGQETRTQESFDVVLRDRMGNPLLVANLNNSREAATEAMMERLITSAERVGQSKDEFAAAFMVTQSFFEPGALETTSAATQGGLLSRNKRKSFVNISRKNGYHLCLVEARNQNFHLTVPEL